MFQRLLKPWAGYRLTLPSQITPVPPPPIPQLTPHNLAGPPPLCRRTASQVSQVHLLSAVAPQGVSFALESVLCPSPALSFSSLINTTSTVIRKQRSSNSCSRA
ncbi:hypothetical protein HanRHA438_Chr11g0485541 [Helianthus annuus]|uniref:Uncharacterized protein n=1 Tax=Helianthus annuus TaxID=4232 RepID=A0A251T7G7_HELAN|nr:hypothetical protein HanHA300_Chr11g0387671 [Helianthus annuus]KAJ0516094.1 hypothetical protein HanHA89_Chr11g0410041 [Helianthus annuus]KAJ0684112.1 hypothetical protein HanLR1_Chr11g0387641 [Helianthus annuus]KAJ0869107.1 hypothetical protein HanRHA438_Chr11g0485541 [Helianthus annuus]